MYKSDNFRPIWRHETTDFIVELHGNEPRYTTDNDRLERLRMHVDTNTRNNENACYIHTASGPDITGFREIFSLKNDSDLYCDGVILQNPGTVFSQTADCPTLVLFNSKTKELVNLHAGRPACTPDKDGGNIVTQALKMIDTDRQSDQITAVITGGIQGKYFTHTADEKGLALAGPFLETFGEVAFADTDTLAIDLVQLLIHQLTVSGIPPTNITHDGLCTFEHPQLSSYRQDRGRTNANTVVVIKK